MADVGLDELAAALGDVREEELEGEVVNDVGGARLRGGQAELGPEHLQHLAVDGVARLELVELAGGLSFLMRLAVTHLPTMLSMGSESRLTA